MGGIFFCYPTGGGIGSERGEERMRYGFGENWREFVERKLSDEIVTQSVEHMRKFMRVDSLAGKTFIDIGCGSGIHSLAAIRLGAARVLAFDYDVNSVETSRKVRDWANTGADWEIMQGSVLDADFMASLPKFDIVYSWGVLHHTGSMWEAVRNAAIPLKDDGEYYIALYSSDNYVDPPPAFWIKLKRAYNQADALTRKLMEIKYFYWMLMRPEIANGRPFANISESYGKRGMTAWTDVKDWLGGYPMEFASFVETRDFCKKELRLDLANVLTGEGCTEYLFARTGDNPRWAAIQAERKLIPMERPFDSDSGFAYAVTLPDALFASADDNSNHMRSRLMVYEDGQPLGLAHALHDHIRTIGRGRFSHWGQRLVFASSDNSDPNRNGRSYAYCTAF